MLLHTFLSSAYLKKKKKEIILSRKIRSGVFVGFNKCGSKLFAKVINRVQARKRVH